MENNNQLTLLDRFNRWLKESITVKLGSIGFLILILLIPNSWIQDLMLERQQRAKDVIVEISSKWSGSQTLTGPILVLPFLTTQEIKRADNSIEKRVITKNAYFLPEDLTIDSKVNPEILHRGIFDAVVYQAQFEINSEFSYPNLSKLRLNESQIKWKGAYVIMGISDLKGINESPSLKVGTKELVAEPSNRLGVSIQQFSNELDDYNGQYYQTSEFLTNGIKAHLNWDNKENFTSNIAIHLNMKGSDRLSFVPSGKTTQVHVEGPWSNPSFDGAFLPVNREINKNGFSADWKILHFNRPFDQSWKTDNVELSNADFGLRLLIPVDQYQKSIRTSKYGILIILLTFVSLFLVEIIKKIRIHPFQYILIGAALIIYYTLLISLSEHVGYNNAYWLSTFLTVGLLGLYSKSFMSELKLVSFFVSVISVIYTFIFIIILQQDFSLLIGSLGLFIITGMIMFFSRKVNWYKEDS